MAINGVEDFAATTNDVNEDRRCLKKLKPLLGIGIVAVSALFFCISNVIVKKLSHVDFFMISCIRFFIIFMMSSPVLMSRVEIKNHLSTIRTGLTDYVNTNYLSCIARSNFSL